jgi:hypothetical protein
MPYRVDVQMRRNGVMTWGPYATERGALLALLERKGTIPGADDRTWTIVPVHAEIDDDLRKFRVTLFEPKDAAFVRGPFHLIGPRLRWDPDFFASRRHPEQFVHATGRQAGVWWLLGDRALGDDASDAVRGGFRFEPTPERLVFLRALGEEQPGLHDPRYRERHAVGRRSVDVLGEPELFARVFPELTRADHARLALGYHGQHVAALAKWHAAVEHATQEHGAAPFAYRAGGVQKDWPAPHRFEILKLARAAAELLDAASAHWQAARVDKRPPWAPDRALRSSTGGGR